MKVAINKPQWSKINWTALMIQVVGIFAILNMIPADMEEQITEAVLLIGPALIQLWRTFFTEPKKVEEPS